jgi:hypothetical protein
METMYEMPLVQAGLLSGLMFAFGHIFLSSTVTNSGTLNHQPNSFVTLALTKPSFLSSSDRCGFITIYTLGRLYMWCVMRMVWCSSISTCTWVSYCYHGHLLIVASCIVLSLLQQSKHQWFDRRPLVLYYC